jgi:hypothetical protein
MTFCETRPANSSWKKVEALAEDVLVRAPAHDHRIVAEDRLEEDQRLFDDTR